ncbi:MAG: YfcC family protein [Halomonas sp.]|uniref:YfcC family protein n=1 Tax=Halomonas sp. TaxID=1486246 RepID=UPI003F912A7F
MTTFSRVPIDKRRRLKLPHIYIILLTCIGLAALATHFITAGEYTRIPGPGGRPVIDPGSFHTVVASPANFMDLMLAIPRGLIGSAQIVFFVLIVGGAFAVLRRTGLIELGVENLSRRFASRRLLLIPTLMIVFALLASFIGVPELSMVYVPILLPLLIALGYDSIVAAAVALCATGLGYSVGVFNPLNTGLAQQLADVPLYSGYPLRIALLAVLLTISIGYIMRYAHRLACNPERGLMADDAIECDKRERYQQIVDYSDSHLSKRQWLATLLALGCLGVLIFGVTRLGWYMTEISGLFILMTLLVGTAAGLAGETICESFTDGCREVMMGALVVGIARGVAVILENGQVLDTMVFSMGQLVSELPPVLSAIGMFTTQLGINFFIPSGSGQALVTMPIMAPLADIVGVTRQTSVLAFQLGDGMSNILYPTAGYFMATLGIAGVPWSKWVHFFLPLFLLWIAIATVFLILAQILQWQG